MPAVERKRMLRNFFSPAILLTASFALAAASGCKRSVQVFPTEELVIKGTSLCVEIASNPGQRRSGYKMRREIPDDTGILFVFPEPQYHAFIMSDVFFPLSIAFIDEKGEIREIKCMKPMDASLTRSSHSVPYALEVAEGWFTQHGIAAGDRVEGLDEIRRHYPPESDYHPAGTQSNSFLKPSL